MPLPQLENLVSIRQLKHEPRDAAEIGRMLVMAKTRLSDSRQSAVSPEGRFSSAYTAAHAAALAALRWHGYRSENRYLVFQCLEHTLGWPAVKWRLLTIAHDVRNRVEYEGYFEYAERDVGDLIEIADALVAAVEHTCGLR